MRSGRCQVGIIEPLPYQSASTTSLAVAAESALGTVGERYHLRAELSRGGMGVVYRALDSTTGREVALKRCLHASHGRGELTRLLFRREYHTLASLRHPRIIDVYDYGVEDGEPYYTMELLDGHDLTEVAPIPWRRACSYLRDVASSLLILHQRQLVHRDLSPRNVRLTGGGFCKLLDFGALSPFGIPTEVVGTPALMSPEVVRGMALDQRSDLFSLGALGYYMLTGLPAFRAQQIAQLEAAWTRAPEPPSALNRQRGVTLGESIPVALDELILSMLSVDALARPVNAAEVIERLSAIAELQGDGGALASELYLTSAISGREQELAALQAVLDLRERVGGVLVEGDSRAGVSRMLKEVALRAQLSGATVLFVDGSSAQGPYAVVRALIRSLYERMPSDATAAIGDSARDLLRAFPELAAHVAAPTGPAPLFNQGAFRAQLQSALIQWWRRLGARRRLVIVVDEAQGADEASVAALAALSMEANGEDVLVVFGRRETDPFVAEVALRALQGSAKRVSLESFSAEATRELLRALLGDAQHGARFSDWVHGLTGGNPGQTVDLLRDLVESGSVRHREGVWILPKDLSARELPSSMEGVQQERLARLGGVALQLAEILSLHDGPVSLELCVRLLPAQDPALVLGALDELVAENVLRMSGNAYRFAQELLRSLVSAGLSASQRERLHVHLAESMLATGQLDAQRRMDAGFHLVQGGDESRGAELLSASALELVSRYDDMTAAAPALELALRIFRQQGRAPHQLLELMIPLCLGGFYVDRRLAERYGEATLALAEEQTGLALARRLRPWLGKHLSLAIGLGRGLLRYLLTPELAGLRGFKRLLTGFSTCIVFLIVKSTICLEPDTIARMASQLEPLTALGKRHAARVSYRFTLGMLALAQGRAADAVRIMSEVLEQLKTPERFTDFPREALGSMRGGALYMIGAMQGFRDDDDALRTAAELERLEHRIFDMAAVQVRINYYACRGDAERAALHRRQLDARALASGSAWQAEVWAPCSQIIADILTEDVLSIKRTLNELQRLSLELPSLRRYEVGARLVYLLQTGRALEALCEFPQMFAGSADNGFIGWVTSRGSLACALTAAGRCMEARQVCRDTLALLSPEDRDYVALNLRVELQLARAELGLGNVAVAREMLLALVARHQVRRGPLTMGRLHEALAEVALASEDDAQFAEHARELEALFRESNNPLLVAQSMRLRMRARAAGRARVDTVAVAEEHAWQEQLDAASTTQVPQVALALLMEDVSADQGSLYVSAEREPLLLASSRALPSSELGELVAREFARRQASATDDAEPLTTIDDVTAVGTELAPAGVLLHPVFQLERLVAIAALERTTQPLLHPSLALSASIASRLGQRAR